MGPVASGRCTPAGQCRQICGTLETSMAAWSNGAIDAAGIAASAAASLRARSSNGSA